MTTCRVLFTGSRRWTDVESVRRVIAMLPPNTIVIHGGHRDRRGPNISLDAIVDRLAREYGLTVRVHEAEWKVHAPGWCRCSPSAKATRGYCAMAGHRRNQGMIDKEKPTEAHAFPLDDSKGTIDCAVRCSRAGVPGMAHGPFAHRVRDAVRADEAKRLRTTP